MGKEESGLRKILIVEDDLAIFGNPADCTVYLDFLYNGKSEKTISC